MGKSWELTQQQKNKLRRPNEMQALYEYNEYVVQQQNQFEKIMEYVNNLVNNLIEAGEISEYTEIRARIKAAKSALKNDPLKALDDVFGMEIITITEHEMKKIMEKLQALMNVHKEKDHDKPNGYKAKHRIMSIKQSQLSKMDIEPEYSELVPMVEFQFKTFETVVRCLSGSAEHSTYKGEKKEVVQERYDNGEYEIFDVPTMWVSRDGKMNMLTLDETLKKMYPFLRTKKKEEKEKEKEAEER